jgi:hypothetical protein
MLLQHYLCGATRGESFTMSKQLSVASAFSVLALSAMALFAPGSAPVSGTDSDRGATIEIAAPAFSAELPLFD